jgi:hypothetical protein
MSAAYFEDHPTDPDKVIMRKKPRLDQGPDYERGFIDGMQYQMQSSVDRAVNSMTVEINSSNTVAVDREYYWQPMDTCPRGVKVQLLGAGGVAVYGQYHGKDPWWTHWAPLPVKPKENT